MERRHAGRQEDRAVSKTIYPCLIVHDGGRAVGGGPCAMAATYFAKDNRARHAHLCRQCWRDLPPSDRDLYAEAAS